MPLRTVSVVQRRNHIRAPIVGRTLMNIDQQTTFKSLLTNCLQFEAKVPTSLEDFADCKLSIFIGKHPQVLKEGVSVKPEFKVEESFKIITECNEILYSFEQKSEPIQKRNPWKDFFQNKPDFFPDNSANQTSVKTLSKKFKVREHVYDIVRETTGGKGFFKSELKKRSAMEKKHELKSIANSVLDTVADCLFYMRGREGMLATANCPVPDFFRF